MQTLVGSASRPDSGGNSPRERSATDQADDQAPSFGGVLADVTADSRRASLAIKNDAKGLASTDQTIVSPLQQNTTAGGVDDPFLDEVSAAARPDQKATDLSSGADLASSPQDTGDPIERNKQGERKTEAEDCSAQPLPPMDLLSLLLSGRGATSFGSVAATNMDPATDIGTPPPMIKAQPDISAAAAGPATAATIMAANVAAEGQQPLVPLQAEDARTVAKADTSPKSETTHAVTATTVSATPVFETHLSPVRPMPDRGALSNASTEPGAATESQKPVPTIEPTALKPPSAVEKDADASLAPQRDSAPVTSAPLAILPTAPTIRAISGAIVEMASRAAPTEAEPATQGATPMARSMILQLSPADLGTVDIRMHVSGDTLDVELTLSDPHAYGLVSRERNDLAAALHDSNYSLHSLVIQESGSAASSGGFHGNSAHSSGGGQPQSERFAGGSDAGQRDRGGGQDRGRGPFEQARAREPAPADRANPAVRRAGSLFV